MSTYNDVCTSIAGKYMISYAGGINWLSILNLEQKGLIDILQQDYVRVQKSR